MDTSSTNLLHKKHSHKKLSIVLLSIVVISLTFITLYHSQTNQAHPTSQQVLGTTNTPQNPSLQKATTPMPLSNTQKMQLTNGTAATTHKKLFQITEGNYYFSPNKITINSGDQITLLFLNTSGIHSFVIDALHIKTPTSGTTQPIITTFTITKKGTYEFYSNIAQDKQQGMKGLLVVK